MAFGVCEKAVAERAAFSGEAAAERALPTAARTRRLRPASWECPFGILPLTFARPCLLSCSPVGRIMEAG